MLNKGQIKDKTEFQTKRKLSNGCFKPFESSVDGDPYGNRNNPLAFFNIWCFAVNGLIMQFTAHFNKLTFSAFQ